MPKYKITTQYGTYEIIADDQKTALEAADMQDQKTISLRGTAAPPAYQEAQEDGGLINFPIDGPTAGSVIGGALGSPLGVPGVVAGSAIGAGVGSMGSDWADGTDADINKAMLEAVKTLGLDIATFGTMRLGRLAYNAIRAKAAKGASPEDIVREMAAGDVADFGTTKARMQSQETLMDEGLSLSPSQTGLASAWEIQKENIARGGFFGKVPFQRIEREAQDLVKNRMAQIIGEADALPAENLGRSISEIIDEGQNIIRMEYGKSLDAIKGRLSGMVPLKSLKSSLSNYRRANSDSLGNSTLNPSTQKALTDLEGLMEDATQAPGRFLLEFDKHVNQKITEVSNFGSQTFNPVAARELTNLSKRIKVRIRTEMSKLDAGAGKEYRRLQNSYKNDIDTLFPKINRSFVNNANKGVYETMGRVFTASNKAENINAFMKSLERAYKLVPKNELQNLPFGSFKEAKAAIRTSYAENRLGSLITEELDVKRFVKEAKRLNDASHASKAKAVLGESYGSYRRLVNLMADVSNKPESGLATLFQRSKEFLVAGGLATAAGQVATGAVGAAGGVVSATAAAGAVLMGPRILARIATNPKHVNKLIEIHKMGFSKQGRGKATEKAALLVNDVIAGAYKEGLSDEDIMSMVGAQ
tara:strand:- start:479 stop:2410 length:1932 start_codon:yes stop_codon:yes gene_type:complete